eukprot:6319874-Amphidinium_carterae.1
MCSGRSCTRLQDCNACKDEDCPEHYLARCKPCNKGCQIKTAKESRSPLKSGHVQSSAHLDQVGCGIVLHLLFSPSLWRTAPIMPHLRTGPSQARSIGTLGRMTIPQPQKLPTLTLRAYDMILKQLSIQLSLTKTAVAGFRHIPAFQWVMGDMSAMLSEHAKTLLDEIAREKGQTDFTALHVDDTTDDDAVPSRCQRHRQ